jgi:predicted pyridoxine 5'-phosphate oxidase superfamily flavin-nucleotide-binding protein
MSGPLKYHEGEIEVQQRAGAFDPADLNGNGLPGTFDPRAADFLRTQSWITVAGLDRDNRIWVSLLHGPAGFLQVNDPGTLTVQAAFLPDDPLNQSFDEENEIEIGVLVLEPRTRRRLRINGRARRIAARTLLIQTREVYGNCPKYIQRRELIGASVDEADDPTAKGIALAEPLSGLSAGHRELIEKADTFFIGSWHAHAGVDCSHRGGQPGFVRVLSERRLAFPDYAGNNMFQTLGNLSLDARAGLLFLDFETGDTLQLTGTAVIHWDEAHRQDWPGAQRVIDIEISQMLARRNAVPLRWRLIDFSPFNPK